MHFGSAEHAAEVTKDRHPGIRDGLQWLTFAHLPEQLRKFSMPFYSAACDLIEVIKTDSPELTTAINGLITAKDSAMRAGIRHDTGRAGSVPRPQEVVEPPQLAESGTPGRPCPACYRSDSEDSRHAPWCTSSPSGSQPPVS